MRIEQSLRLSEMAGRLSQLRAPDEYECRPSRMSTQHVSLAEVCAKLYPSVLPEMCSP